MKFLIAAIVAQGFALQAFSLPATAALEVGNFVLLPVFLSLTPPMQRRTCGFATVPLLRAFSPSEGDHFYTTNVSEMETVVGTRIYDSEGDAATVLPTQAPLTVPLYRLYSIGVQDHLYTTSETERDNASNNGFSYEGVAAYVYPENDCGTVPLFRMYSPSATDHFYTTNAAERENAIANFGYVDEGTACFVNPQ